MTDPLHSARERARRHTELAARLAGLQGDVRSLERRLARLVARAGKEADDVQRVEREGFASLFRSLMGTQEARLVEERAEAFRAAFHRDRARTALSRLRTEVEPLEREVARLAGAGEELARMLAEREQAWRSAGRPRAEELARLGAEQRELEERIATRNALLEATLRSRTEVAQASGALELALLQSRSGMLAQLSSSTSKFEHFDQATRVLIQARPGLRRLEKATGERLGLRGLVRHLPEWVRTRDRWYAEGGWHHALDQSVRVSLAEVRRLERELARIANGLEAECGRDRERVAVLARQREDLLAAGPGA